MAGITQHRFQAAEPAHQDCSIHDSHAELIRAIQGVGGKDCFATDLSDVCPDLYCRWREDCIRLGSV